MAARKYGKHNRRIRGDASILKGKPHMVGGEGGGALWGLLSSSRKNTGLKQVSYGAFSFFHLCIQKKQRSNNSAAYRCQSEPTSRCVNSFAS